MGTKSPRITAIRVPRGAIDPKTLDNHEAVAQGKRRRLTKAQHLPSYAVVRDVLQISDACSKQWLDGRVPMPVEFFYALVRHLDIAPAKAILMAEELYHRRVRHLQSVTERRRAN